MTERITEYPGTPLKERHFTEGKVLQTWWTPKTDYAWDAGVAVGRFLAGLKEGKILAIQCPQCSRILVPPRMVCEHCFVPTSHWVELPGSGTVKTFSITSVTWDMQRLDKPLIPAVIDLDGASPGMAIMHLLDDVDPDDVRIGLRVEAVWRPADEREAAITDIRYFRPIKEVAQ
jgi:uncharacterized OB-fold protein